MFEAKMLVKKNKIFCERIVKLDENYLKYYKDEEIRFETKLEDLNFVENKEKEYLLLFSKNR